MGSSPASTTISSLGSDTRHDIFGGPSDFDVDTFPSTLKSLSNQTFSSVHEVPSPTEGNITPAFDSLDLVRSDWPPDLPPPDLLQHLYVIKLHALYYEVAYLCTNAGLTFSSLFIHILVDYSIHRALWHH